MIFVLITLTILNIYFWRKSVSKTAELTNAVNANTDAVNKAVSALQGVAANNTPDADVSAQITQVEANTAALTAVAP